MLLSTIMLTLLYAKLYATLCINKREIPFVIAFSLRKIVLIAVSKRPQQQRNAPRVFSVKALRKHHKCEIPFVIANDSDENRTRVTAVKGRCLNRLTTEP